jgi:hypothetical protein
MRWQFVNTGFNSGKFNMDYDIDLARNIKPCEALLHFLRCESKF